MALLRFTPNPNSLGDASSDQMMYKKVFPEDKYNIVEHLQRGNRIVGMTGDGVNDAPALKKANIGIAVSGSTDAARSASDIVLTKEGLSVIVDAIIGSRKIFQRMKVTTHIQSLAKA